MTDKPPYANVLSKFIGFSVILLGLLYACGLFVSHFHLRHFGVYEISSFHMTYLLVGFTLMLILLAPILVLTAILTIAIRQTSIISRILELSIVTLLAVSALIYMIMFFFYGDFEWGWIFTKSSQIIRMGNLYWVLYAWLFYATGKSLIDDLLKIKQGEILPSKELWVPSIFLFTLFILYSTFYANIIHPNIHSSLGGGKPIPAEIHISEEGAETVQSLGLIPDSDRNLRDISIIHETSSTVYIIPPEKEKKGEIICIVLPKSQIHGIKYLSQENRQ